MIDGPVGDEHSIWTKEFQSRPEFGERCDLLRHLLGHHGHLASELAEQFDMTTTNGAETDH
jgi:hypothetical protein